MAAKLSLFPPAGYNTVSACLGREINKLYFFLEVASQRALRFLISSDSRRSLKKGWHPLPWSCPCVLVNCLRASSGFLLLAF